MGVCFQPPCLVTELLDTSLFDVLYKAKQVLTNRQKVHIALGVARGLASLHGHSPPIVHRDVKSLNILVSSDLVSVKVGAQGDTSGWWGQAAMSRMRCAWHRASLSLLVLSLSSALVSLADLRPRHGEVQSGSGPATGSIRHTQLESVAQNKQLGRECDVRLCAARWCDTEEESAVFSPHYFD